MLGVIRREVIILSAEDKEPASPAALLRLGSAVLLVLPESIVTPIRRHDVRLYGQRCGLWCSRYV